MKLIKRLDYLNKLRNVRGTPDIKVITGIRRSGKSKLLESYIQSIIEEDADANVIHIDFNNDEFEKLLDYHELLSYVKSHFQRTKNNYLLIDEIQMCDGFEKAVNSLHSSGNYDIYITGSNAFLLSSDLATLFTGRTFEIEVFPFSFKEYIEYFKKENIYAAYNDYLVEGGMSGSYLYRTQEDKYKYINNTFETMILRDIKQKYKVRNELLLAKVTDFLVDNVSNLLSFRKLAEYINATGDHIDHKTVSKFIGYLCNSFAFYRFKRFDIRGKKYLSTSEKYYLSDHSFKYARLGTRNPDYGRTLENIVAIELLRRGYQVYVGTLYKKEIDFVAMKQNEKIYIQVANSIEDEKTKNRELSPLMQINDSYPKIVITRTGYPEYDIDGIKVVDISEWLLK